MIVYVGCTTDVTHPLGLHALDVDLKTGAMRVVASYPVSRALYQALSPDGRFLYSCEAKGLVAFRADGAKLVETDRLDLDARCVCHVSLSSDARTLYWADYLRGRAGSVAVSNGVFGASEIRTHRGKGPNLPRQDGPHCHQAVPLPDGSGYCVVDLGLDAIVSYPSGRIFETSPKGAGPRHLVFHPNGRLAFVLSELWSQLSTCSWNPSAGFRPLCTVPTLAAGDHGRGDNRDLAAAVRLTPDARRVIVSNRGEESLVAFDFDVGTGALAFKARTVLPGSWPRDFVFLDDTLALVALERSDKVVALRYDPEAATFAVVNELGLHGAVAVLPAK